jgi:hypothetical protein
MADLESDNVTIGNFIRALVKNRDKCTQMEKDDKFATEEFRKVLTLKDGQTIKVHLDQEDVTHVIIPLQKDMADAEAMVTTKNRGYPDSYVASPLTEFNAEANPDKAFSFRVGEYTMRRCKG